jgi:hypothetical protein
MFRELPGFESHIKGNVVVAQFINKAGELETKAFTTIDNEIQIKALGYDKLGLDFTDRVHTEYIAKAWFEKNGIDFKKVIGIFSELEPCMLRDHRCKVLLKELFPNAKIEFSRYYPGNGINDIFEAKLRRESVKIINKLSKEFLKTN